jgi:hypothetical protein
MFLFNNPNSKRKSVTIALLSVLLISALAGALLFKPSEGEESEAIFFDDFEGTEINTEK